MRNNIIILLILGISCKGFAQKDITLGEAIQMALGNHPSVKAAEADERRQRSLRPTSLEMDKTNFTLTKGQYNSFSTADNNITISQSFSFPGTWMAKKKQNDALVKGSEYKSDATRAEVVYQVKQAFFDCLYFSEWNRLLSKEDSLFSSMAQSVLARFKAGEATLLEKTSMETQLSGVRNRMKQNEADYQNAMGRLQRLLFTEEVIRPQGEFTQGNTLSDFQFSNSPLVKYKEQEVQAVQWEKKVERSRLLPDFTVGYFSQTLIGFQNLNGQETYFGPSKRFQGFSVGISLPLFFAPYTAKSKAASYNLDAMRYEQEAYGAAYRSQVEQARKELGKDQENLSYYHQAALPNAALIEKQATLSFRSGDIDFTTFLFSLKQALGIREEYLQAMFKYQQSLSHIEYLTGSVSQ